MLPPARCWQLLQTRAEHPGSPPTPSDGPGRSSTWQTCGTPQAVVWEQPSPALEGNPVDEVHSLIAPPRISICYIRTQSWKKIIKKKKRNKNLSEQLNAIIQRSVHSTDEGVGFIFLLHDGPERLKHGCSALGLGFQRHGRTLVRNSFGFPPFL